MQNQELFQGYEVKNWDFSPRIYKILAASAVFNILALFVVAQSNLLTTKGCDSPLVGGVCQVLDTLIVGGSVLTTDTAMVDKDYEKTELENAEIIWIDQTGAEDFKYPEGYFSLSNPELMMPQEIPGDGSFPANIPGITPPTSGGGTDLMNTPQVLPNQNNNPTLGEMPKTPFEFDKNPTIVRKNPRGKTTKPQKNPTINDKSPTVLPDVNSNQTADKDPNKAVKEPTENKNETVSEVEINRKVMKDFASVVKTRYDKKEIDLTQNFLVVADGVLTKEGKLDTTVDKKTKQPKTRIVKAEGNQQMIEIASQAIAAIGDSGWLGHLSNRGVEKIVFTVVQDNDNLQVIITSDFPTPERATSVTTLLNTAIQTALLADKNGWKPLGSDEKTLLSNAKAVVNPQNNKQFVLNFVLSKPIAQEMITRKLNEPVKPEPQSTAQIKENNKTSSK